MLDIIDGRVLGALIEKQLTTPDIYPLSLNALGLACNQSTARDPVMNLSGPDIEESIARLKEQKLARIVHPLHMAQLHADRILPCLEQPWELAWNVPFLLRSLLPRLATLPRILEP